MVGSKPQKTINLEDLIKRVRVALVLIPVGLAANILGGWVYCLLVALIIGVAAYEYALLYKASGLRPAVVLSVGAAVLIVIGQSFNRFELTALIFTASLMISVVYHLFEYERGRDQAATDFAVTISAVVYVGWLGSYFVSLRNLPDGFWWMMIVLPAVWLADTAAYIFGKRFGKHKMTRRLSPNKTWEGYLAGILVAAPGTALLALLWQFLGAGEGISPWRGALLGGVLALLAIFGDLGESMIKRQASAKDSGQILPGHGGVFDRIDSWLWAGAIGYYLIMLVFY